ncbi:Zinc finger, CCHC-type [Rhizoctonia solani]|uniref:Zinc finger, CCHC-type n=1 Tax=Rhizoctonia solani TaxID=456999 RepID=A0A8H8SZZ0_9AGAM|nr:Zinc finger, CCHC-type [Rhizoctonia solani]QRW23934.1 Zinc finger, CCHC-type [Rhizoctonia solani]
MVHPMARLTPPAAGDIRPSTQTPLQVYAVTSGVVVYVIVGHRAHTCINVQTPKETILSYLPKSPVGSASHFKAAGLGNFTILDTDKFCVGTGKGANPSETRSFLRRFLQDNFRFQTVTQIYSFLEIICNANTQNAEWKLEDGQASILHLWQWPKLITFLGAFTYVSKARWERGTKNWRRYTISSRGEHLEWSNSVVVPTWLLVIIDCTLVSLLNWLASTVFKPVLGPEDQVVVKPVA